MGADALGQGQADFVEGAPVSTGWGHLQAHVHNTAAPLRPHWLPDAQDTQHAFGCSRVQSFSHPFRFTLHAQVSLVAVQSQLVPCCSARSLNIATTALLRPPHSCACTCCDVRPSARGVSTTMSRM